MTQPAGPSLVRCLLALALAGGMGWGIRGQYGHETGAMIAGVLVGLVLVLLFVPDATSRSAARAAALLALGISLGGSMTYGQTVGLTHDPELIGNWQALGWGMLGLFLKGGIWIGLGATFLGLGLSGRRYRPLEVSLLLISLCFLWYLGFHLLNQPFDPMQRMLPRIYFSDSWHWEPEATELQPRREVWGGLLAALIGLVLYARLAKGDRLALRLAIWGFVGGGIGFALGQSLQAAHAWNLEWFHSTALLQRFDSHINWWNMMETTFGAVFGAFLALAVWLNQDLISLPRHSNTDDASDVELRPVGEWLLVLVHVPALLAWNFLSLPDFEQFADRAIPMVLIPAIAVVAGRWWPYLLLLPITIAPIAGKTVRELVYESGAVAAPIGWGAYLAVPLVLTLGTACWLVRRQSEQPAARFASCALLVNTWVYFWLNFAFFRNPWPWQAWTNRTPNALIFFVCAAGLSLAALLPGVTQTEQTGTE